MNGRILGILSCAVLAYTTGCLLAQPGQPKTAVINEQGKAADEGKPAATNTGNAQYPRVHADGRATFRLKAPDAKKVQVFTNYGLGPRGHWDMAKGNDGVWTFTSP